MDMEPDDAKVEQREVSRRDLGLQLTKLAGAAAFISAVVKPSPASAAPPPADQKVLIERLTNTRYEVRIQEPINQGTTQADTVDYVKVDPRNVHQGTSGLEDWLFDDDNGLKNIRSNSPDSQKCLTDKIKWPDNQDDHAGTGSLADWDVNYLSRIVNYLDSGSHWTVLHNKNAADTSLYLNDVYHVLKHKINYEMDYAKARGIAGFLAYLNVVPGAPEQPVRDQLLQLALDYLRNNVYDQNNYRPIIRNYYGQYGLIDYLMTEQRFRDMIQEEQAPRQPGPAQGESWY